MRTCNLLLIFALVFVTSAVGQRSSTTSASTRSKPTRTSKAQRTNSNNINSYQLTSPVRCTPQSADSFDSASAYYLGQRPLPENDREYRLLCTEFSSYLKWSDEYIRKCFESFARKIASALMYTVNAQYKRLCKAGRIPKKGRELMTAANCGNAARTDIVRCFNQTTEHLTAIAEKAPDKIKLPLGCCHYHKMKNCMISAMDDEKRCTKRHIDLVERFVTESVQSTLDLACYEYPENTDKCNSVLAKTPTREPGKPTAKSFLLPIIDILNSIKDPE